MDIGSPEGGFEGQPENYRFFQTDVARWLDRRAKDADRGYFNAKGPVEVIIDPPREGLGDVTTLAEPEVVERLIAQHRERVSASR